MPVQAARISDRVGLLRPTAVNSILREARALQAQGAKLVSLMRGEPDFRTPEHIIEAAERALRGGRTGYPDNRGEAALREAVAAKLERENAVSYDPGSEILITDGATMGLCAAFLALLNPGDEVLIPDPIYDAYHSAIRLTGASVRLVSSNREGARFGFSVDELQRAVTPHTRMLLLNTPWNPVGTVFTRPELNEMAEFVERHDLILITDEIYEHITYDGHRHVSAASISDELRRRCVLINSLSKTYAMTGWRAGFCAAPRDIIDAMLLVLQQSSRGPAIFVQDAAAAALNGPPDCVEKMRAEYAARRGAVLESLNGLGKVQALPPEGGFFAMVDVSNCGRSSDDVRRHLLNHFGLVVIHGGAYGPGGEGTLRVSFASGGENLARGLQALRDGLAAL